jgi:ribosome-associated protein
VAARAAAEKKAEEVIALDVSEHLVLTDVFLVASGSNERPVRSIVEAIEDALREEGVKPVRTEGRSEARWVLADYSDIVVHVQHAEDREYYALERLWRDCPVVELDLEGIGDEDANGPDEAGAGGSDSDGSDPVEARQDEAGEAR